MICQPAHRDRTETDETACRRSDEHDHPVAHVQAVSNVRCEHRESPGRNWSRALSVAKTITVIAPAWRKPSRSDSEVSPTPGRRSSGGAAALFGLLAFGLEVEDPSGHFARRGRTESRLGRRARRSRGSAAPVSRIRVGKGAPPGWTISTTTEGRIGSVRCRRPPYAFPEPY